MAFLFPATATAAPLDLSASAMYPGEAGSFTVDSAGEGLPEGSAVWFMIGTSEGEGPCPGYLEGQCWDIMSPRFVQVEWTDDSGLAIWDFTVDAALEIGESRSMQAAVNGPSGVLLSGPVTVTLEAPGSICPEDWLVGTPCNGTDLGGGCTPAETGYHFNGWFNKDGQDFACWWSTKNQAWNTTTDSNYHALATQFELESEGGWGWCYPRDSDPCDSGACFIHADDGYFGPDDSHWGWCGGAPFTSGGHVCIPAPPERAASCSAG